MKIIWWLTVAATLSVTSGCAVAAPTPQEIAAGHAQEIQDCRDLIKKYHLTGTPEQCLAFRAAEIEDEAEHDNGCTGSGDTAALSPGC